MVTTRSRRQLLGTTTISTACALLVVLPKPGIVEFCARLPESAGPGCLSLVPEAAHSRASPQASPVAEMSLVSISITAPSSPVLLTGWLTVLSPLLHYHDQHPQVSVTAPSQAPLPPSLFTPSILPA